MSLFGGCWVGSSQTLMTRPSCGVHFELDPSRVPPRWSAEGMKAGFFFLMPCEQCAWSAKQLFCEGSVRSARKFVESLHPHCFFSGGTGEIVRFHVRVKPQI